MSDTKYIFGPVPSRRLGQSLGVSPIPKKTCNYKQFEYYVFEQIHYIPEVDLLLIVRFDFHYYILHR